ncbi:MAG TPA: RcpC/CpaB family pilus assembly protein [Candidatus Dormibacteraeota bacterium]|nr:RcpC/CpaB family pilus assembly protein [Candidatus Dormibacteraeota bacterium]
MATAPAPARPRPGGGRLFIIVGLLLALLAGAGVFFLPGLLGTTTSGNISGGSQTVVVAKQNIPLRHQITSSDLTTASAAGSFIAVNAYQRPSDVVNLIAEINIKAGSIITSDMLARDLGQINAGSGPAYLPLASGYVAMTIPTSEQQGVAGHITLGDYITVIASANVTVFATSGQQQGPPKVVSKTVFTNVRIIGVGPAQINVQPAGGTTTSTTQQPTGGVTSSLTIELTQCDAEYMVWFLNNTQLRYTLESFNDYLKQPPSAPDPSCPSVVAAQGVSNKGVDARYHFSTT